MMRVVHKHGEEVVEKPEKRVPMYKDRALIEEMKRILIAEHNRKVEAKQQGK